MYRIFNRIPSIQRKLMFLLFASVLMFLVYLVMTSGIQNKKEELERVKEEKPPLKTEKPEVPKPTTKADTGGGNKPHNPYAGPQNERQKEVVGAFMHAWNAYKKYAWGHDELRPLTHDWQEWFGIGLTIVDSLDTIYIMGLEDEFRLGREWVAKNLTFTSHRDVQLFEIVIRALGGLLSAYHLSGDQVFADKALDLGTRLLPCFGGPTKIPCNRINLNSRHPSFIEISTAETGTIQLEFRDLARVTKQKQFEDVVDAVSLHLHQMKKFDGMVSCFISAQTGSFRQSSAISFGASADSYYEYLVKQWLQTGKKNDWMIKDYLESVEGMKKHLLKHTEPNKLAFVGSYSSLYSKHFRSEMEHLACFVPGMLALGAMNDVGTDHLQIAKDVGKTCYEMYHRMPTGLSPEVAIMNMRKENSEDISGNFGASFNLQRPETVESLFYLYRATKDEKYRDWAWEIFQSFEKYTKLKEGYTSIDNVRRPENPGYRNKMETFYLAETLKYLYLIFSDDPELIPLDKFVINTEAHPLPIYDS